MKLNRSALGRFALTPLAHVAVAALTVASPTVWSLGLGKLTVQSALGETLKAEIDVSTLSPEEAGTLKVRIAPPESYRATGIEYNAVLTGTQVQLARRSDGRPVLRINSDRAVQEPFVDVILELTWASGRLVREYTLLFDPPNLARPSAPAEVATAPVISSAPPETSPVAAPRAPASAAIAAAPSAPRPSAPATKPRAEPSPPAAEPQRAARSAAPAPAPAPTSAAASEYTVKPGDTLSRVANRTKPQGISLDQMLVGLFRSNPDAFIGENMNRLKSGVVLQVPGSDSLNTISQPEAREVIQAQSADFSGYRQRLASGAPELKLDESQRQAKGKVQAAVEDRKPASAPSPDKLTLSKAGAGAGAASEATVSKETEKKADSARVAELTRNVEELKKLSSAAKPAAPGASTAAAASAVTAAALPAVTPAPTPSPAPQPTESVPAVTKAAASATPSPAPLPPAEEEPGLMAELMDSPLVLPIAGVLVALLGGLGLMRLRGRGTKPKADTGFHESRLQPDSFFGATGGQRVDTRDAGAASSMSYSLSQLDAIGDVDPVAEADVYLAYGRDLQAEEILKEALRSNPERLAIRLKLLEVYAKRRDTKGFEQLAVQLYAETQGQGEDWAKAQELGRQIDADNPLYQPGGAPSMLQGDGDYLHPEPMNASTLPQTAQHSTISGAHLSTEPLNRAPISDPGPPSGLDLDLDLDLGSPPSVSPFAMDATQALATTVEQAPLAMDFELDGPPPTTVPGAVDSNELAFDLGNLDLPDENTQTATLEAELRGQTESPAPLDFDLSSIDLDLPESAPAEPPIPVAAAAPLDDGLPAEFDSLLQEEEVADPLSQAFDALEDDGGDPLQRQLELADEFRQIGDTEGARDVLQELLAKASGPLRDKAEAMLNELR